MFKVGRYLRRVHREGRPIADWYTQRSFRASGDKVAKNKISKKSFNDVKKQRMRDVLNNTTTPDTSPSIGGASPKLNSAIVTIAIGKDQRLFAAHEDVLARSPWFAEACRQQFFSSPGQRRISLPDEEPEIFSAVLEFLYKGDYFPRLIHDRRKDTWYAFSMNLLFFERSSCSSRQIYGEHVLKMRSWFLLC